MSHLKERSHRNCLNCNAQLSGKYCHICGQENLEPVESAWHLVTHFFNDITHFDGKFFSTLKYLIFRPGFLSMEYKIGRRASYLNPVRMYVFTSAIFFLIFFSINHLEDSISNNGNNKKDVKKSGETISSGTDEFISGFNAGNEAFEKKPASLADSSEKENGLQFPGANYRDKSTYDSLVKTGVIKDNWFKRKVVYKEIEIKEKYKNDRGKLSEAFVHNLLHSFPQMLFISLPLFALMLKLLYFRHKDYYYASHAIFSIHIYVFVFIMMLFIMGLTQANHYLHWGVFTYIYFITGFYIFYYQYKSIRNFYQQRRGKTILKYMLLNGMMIFILSLLFLGFIFFSLFKL